MKSLRSNLLQFSTLCLSLLLMLAAIGCGASGSSSNPTQPKTLTGITVTPATATVAVSATQQFTATGTYSDGSTADVTSSAAWSSATTSVATINAAGMATAVTAGSATVTATIGSVSGSATLTVSAAAPTLVSLAVTPGTATTPIGGAQQFTATGNYSDGSTQNLTTSASWTSSTTTTATVSASGLATAVAAGTTTITATVNGVSGTATLTVPATTPTLTGITIAPTTANIAPGATQQFAATAVYSDGSTSTVTATATWTSSNNSVATVNTAGLATAVAAGTATITATIGGISGTAALTVTQKSIKTLAVTPATPSIAAGATQQFIATATYSDGSTGNVTSTVTWSSSATSVATINTAGLATAVASGTSTITATASGVSGTATLTVTPQTPQSIAITPNATSFAQGATQQFTATATYSNGSTANITSSVTWASSNTSVVTINSSGLATGVSSGSASITATQNGVTGSTTLTVTARTPTSIAVTPNPASFDVNSTQQFTAKATYADGTTADVTSSATWTSSNTSVATINNAGLATGVAAGTTTVTAAVGTVKGTSSATVTTPATNGVNITTWHVDNNRSGLNSNETSLTQSNVNSSTFGKLFSYQVDGYVYGEPLIMSGVTIGGAKHDVVYVATEHDSVYAFDADNYGTGAPLWQVSLLQTGESPITDGPVQPYEGVTSTPVIDPGTNTLYVVSSQTSSAAGGTFRLHALDITTGAEKFGGPVVISASVAATNSDSSGGVQTLNTSCIQRAALLLANGNVYMGFGSCHSGWLLAYNATTLAQVGVFNSSVHLDGEGPYASAGGIWMGSGGPVADSAGNVYVTTGNGPWDGSTAWGDSVLKFGPTPAPGNNGTMQPIDYFTPSIYAYMDCNDADLAAGGLMMIPGSSQLLAGGKTGSIFNVNGQNLGKETANDSGATQELVWGSGLPGGGTYTSQPCPYAPGNLTASITSYEIFGTAAYYNNYVYLGVTPTGTGAPGGVRQFEFSGNQLSASAMSTPSQNQGTRGTSPFISSDGTSNGIVWVIDQGYPIQNTQSDPSNPGTTMPPTSATLYAYNADEYPTELYDSTQNPADTPGYGIKFTSPVVANGKVYISTAHDLTTVANPHGEIDVYGLK